MSKHTTRPLPWRYRNCAFHVNSHTFNTDLYAVGNWNRHKKRRIPSRMRTAGRQCRYQRRHNGELS